MGIPAAFRWLSNKYPKIISPVIEDQPLTTEDGSTIPVDITRPNPNGEEFDNLYLDMNAIVHPCSHPEDRPAPKDEEEMMIEVFRYTDRIVNMVRPRKILMLAGDGVAPRAKMNQQRSRRFRSAQDAKEKEHDKQEYMKLLKQQNGGDLSAESLEIITKKAFDSNSITPGTPFMDILALSLRYWCQYKLNTDPGWSKLKIIISDATVPGEGEHKIMNFIRSQRTSPDHDPNTRHIIYGLDADHIMLGLATHEPHFRVLREDVFFQEQKVYLCKLCGQKGHDAQNCHGEKKKDGEHQEKDKGIGLKPFIWLHVAVLREYLEIELYIPNLPFRFDLERAIDDWIFMCCFVGNDFLSHLPALEIREHGIDTLTKIWKENLPIMGGYVTKDGHINLERAQIILDRLAQQEDNIFKRRKEQEKRREANAKQRKLQNNSHGRGGRQGGPAHPKKINGLKNSANGLPLHPIASYASQPDKALTHMVMNHSTAPDMNIANKSAVSMLQAQLQSQQSLLTTNPANNNQEAPSALGKRKALAIKEGDELTSDTPPAATLSAPAEEDLVDDVRLWEDGYADRYYEKKFHKGPNDIEFRHQVARAYVEGLAWVLLYYFQGCPSWEWYYPYHYAPFAADFKDIAKMNICFEKGRISKPFEQLMSVLPAASRHALPEVFHDLMLNPDSDIIDFYPEDFKIDLNGKKMAWQGIALLPFIEMPRLLAAVQAKYPELSATDAARNEIGRDVLIFSEGHESLYDEILTKFYSKKQGYSKFKLNPKKSDGLSGKVEKMDTYIPHGELKYPLERRLMPDLDYDRSLSVYYDFPQVSQTHKSMLLRGVQLPKPALTQSDIDIIKSEANRSGRNHGGFRGGRNRGGYSAPGISHGPRYGRSQGGYGRSNGHHTSQPPPQAPPQPGGSFSFGVDPPPGPPPAHYYNNRPLGNYRGGYSGYNQNRGPRSSHGPPGYLEYGGQSYESGRGSGSYSSGGYSSRSQ